MWTATQALGPMALVLPGWAWGLLALIGAWVLASAAIQWAAARAHALGEHEAPSCFRTPPLAGPEAASANLAFLGDLQRGVVDAAVPLARALKESRVDLMVSSGDFASHGEAPYFGVLLDAFDRAGVDTPVRVVPGNHDLFPRRSKDDTLGGAIFERHFGPRHWTLRAGPVLVAGLDTGADWLLDEQLPWLEAELARHSGVPWICVTHRPPWNFDDPERTAYADLTELAPFFAKHKPALVISGHLHDYRDETIDGIRYIVNAHGGDVHGLALSRSSFELLHVTCHESGMTVEPRPIERRASARTAWHQLLVRVWAERRKPLGAFLGWPADQLLRLVGRAVPVPRYPEERRHPDRETLRARRAAHRAATREATR